jgi:hypothetical protein
VNFLSPLFLLGLGALAIPVLIHLIQREKKQILQFPSLMFIRRVPYKSVQRRRVHNWLLLLIRAAAMLLIIAAFARPFFGTDGVAAAPGTGARELVVLLDQSYSMGYGDRWDRARAAVRDALGQLGPADRGSVVLFASNAEIAVRSTNEQGRLLGAVPTGSPSAGATRYSPALKVANSILAESSLPRREVLLVSDFQRGGWRGQEGTTLPRGTTVTPVSVANAVTTPNVAVTSVALGRSTFSNQERVTVTAAVVNRSEQAMSGGSLTLEFGGRVVQSERLDVPANGTASVAFMPITVTGANMRGVVRVGNDGLVLDNAFSFVLSPARPVRVLLIDYGGSANLYLTRALAVGDSPRYDVVIRQPDAVTDEDLQRASAVLVNDINVSAGLGRRLSRVLERGGGLFVVAGARAAWPSEVDVLPGTLGGPSDRSRNNESRVGGLVFGHPVFEVFRAPRSGDFSTVRFYGYRNLSAAAGALVIARFDGGTPALLERQVGTGRVLLWGSTLDLAWSDLPLKPVYLPFIHRSLQYLASYREPAPWLTVGQVFDADGAGAGSGQRAAITPSGRRVALDDEAGPVVELTEQGFYEIRQRPGQSNEAEAAVVAANVDSAESDLTPMDPKEIVAAALANSSGNGGSADLIPQTPEAQERSQRIWWYLLVLGVMLLGADTLLSNRLSKA